MRFIGKYQVIREIGQGATALVYLCLDPDSGREVAVKLIQFGRDSAVMSRRMRKLFQNEAQVSKRLSHPNIVQVFDVVVEENQAYLAMEYVNGRSLEEFTRIDRLLPLHRVVSIIFKCAMALDSAYKQGIVHRDIKPANILLTADFEPKIADFGLSLNLSKDLERDSTHIMGVGSPAYMSPEQIKGYQLNQKTDLYSLGVVMFQLLCGRLPFRAKNQATLIYRIINNDPPAVTDLNPNLPEGLNFILRKALEKDLYNRYKNGTEFAKDLSAVRYQILEEDRTEQDCRHFETLRKLDFFVEFENIEIWEILRVAVWRKLPAGTAIIVEGEQSKLFGVVVSGGAEISLGGKLLCALGGSEPVGEMAFLHPTKSERCTSVVTTEETVFLEINPAALALASEELMERMRNALLARMIDRFRKVNQRLAAHAETPMAAKGQKRMQGGGQFGLELLPM